MSTIDNTLEERGTRYGEFPQHARITQNLKRAMNDSPNWASLPDDMKEALEMVAHKIGRILNGDPDYSDSWHDIIGYTRLVEERLVTKEAASVSIKAEDLELVPFDEEMIVVQEPGMSRH